MTQEGIFRISGSASDITRLRDQLDRGKSPSEVFAETRDIHAVTGLLKQFLRELTEPLCTFALYDAFLATMDGPPPRRSRSHRHATCTHPRRIRSAGRLLTACSDRGAPPPLPTHTVLGTAAASQGNAIRLAAYDVASRD